MACGSACDAGISRIDGSRAGGEGTRLSGGAVGIASSRGNQRTGQRTILRSSGAASSGTRGESSQCESQGKPKTERYCLTYLIPAIGPARGARFVNGRLANHQVD